MSALNSQKDLIANFKREVLSNTSILSKVYLIDHDLSRRIFKEDALEKPTQQIFIHLSYFLVCIIDSQRSKLITWPLFDTRAEKNYKNELSSFVAEYHKLGLLAPVMSSYFVNPGCFKVVKLLFQLSHLAVQRTLRGRLSKQSLVTLYEDITIKYKSMKEDFVPIIEKETAKVLNSFSKFMQQKKTIEDTIIAVLHKKILENEKKLASIKDQMLLDDLIESFIKTNKLNSENLNIMLDLKKNKDVHKIFDKWLEQTDCFITEMNNGWNEKFTKVVKLAESCRNTSQTLIARQTGDADKKQYSIEFNHKTDVIQTSPLEAAVSVQQKYILKNIINRDKLHFPTLIRAYLISISHILNGVDLTDDWDGFNIAMECEVKNYEEVLSALKALIDRIDYAEGRLLPQPLLCYDTSMNIKEFTDIPPLPDLSDLKTTRDLPFQSAFESFTPLTLSKHQFNLKKRYANSQSIFVAPQPRLFATPAHALREDFLKTIQSCKMGSFDKTNRTQNISIVTEASKRINETIADCNTGFTKEQIQRLLSTNKGSTTKKHKFNLNRPRMNIKKGGLFNDTADASMAQSYLSPDLFSKKNNRQQLLAVVQENIPALFEVSGISIIRNNSDCNTQNENILSEPSSGTVFGLLNTSVINISPVQYLDNDCGNHILKTVNLEDNIVQKTQQEINFSTEKVRTSNLEIFEQKSALEETKTPQNINRTSRKSSSIEKIINRFKKVKASVLNDTNNDLSNCSIIREEKENNFTAANVNLLYTKKVDTKKVIVPDLLRPNYAVDESQNKELNGENNSFEELYFRFEEGNSKKARQSLGSALGVDQRFLDQFELID